MSRSGPSPLPDNALDLTQKQALRCCDRSDVTISHHKDRLAMRCQSCRLEVSVSRRIPSLHRKNVLKGKEQLLHVMRKGVEDLIRKWNFKVITGMDE